MAGGAAAFEEYFYKSSLVVTFYGQYLQANAESGQCPPFRALRPWPISHCGGNENR